MFFIVEVFIAQTSGFIRHTIGDYLVVILLYTLLRTFVKSSVKTMCVITLLIAYFVEFIQLTSFLEFLHLENNYTANIIFGNTFSITDLMAYTLGIITVFCVEFIYRRLASANKIIG